MATVKEELLVLEIQANYRHTRQVAVTCRRGTSVASSLKLLALPYPFLELIKYNIILSTNRSYVISPYKTNKKRKATRRSLPFLLYCNNTPLRA